MQHTKEEGEKTTTPNVQELKVRNIPLLFLSLSFFCFVLFLEQSKETFCSGRSASPAFPPEVPLLRLTFPHFSNVFPFLLPHL